MHLEDEVGHYDTRPTALRCVTGWVLAGVIVGGSFLATLYVIGVSNSQWGM